jgi:hypothetical protein
MSAPTAFRLIGLTAALMGVICPGALGQTENLPPNGVRVVRLEHDPDTVAYRASLTRCRPPVRGFRVCLTDPRWRHWPLYLPGEDSTPVIRKAALSIAQHLADEGLLATTAKTIATLSPLTGSMDDEQVLSLLRTVGLPVDLLGYFQLSSSADGDALLTLKEIRRILAGSRGLAGALDEIAKARFLFKQTHPRFSALAEGDESPIGLVRLQLSSPDYWRGPGDGSGVDITQQLLRNLPDAQFLIAIDDRNTSRLLNHLQTWQPHRRGQVVVAAMPESPTPQTLDQWAQDVGKPGLLRGQSAGKGEWATLVPRYASRGEESTVFDPATAFVGELLQKAGHTIVESPLLFQGGNLLIARIPSTGKRTLLVGEAEICRNTALGLTSAQALDALRIEMGADDAIILPAVSFHLDFEISLREHGGKLVAFVNDSTAAARHITRLGTATMLSAGALSKDDADKATQLATAGHDDQFVTAISPGVMKLIGPQGVFPVASTRWFAAGAVDSGASNLERFLLSMDLLASRGGADQPLPTEPFAQAYIVSLRQRDADREALGARLRELGCEVVAVPSTADEDRSVNYINALHEKGRVFMPAYGGFLSSLDESAAAAFRDALGSEVAIIPIYSAESQRRLGAIHCSAAIYRKM